MSRGISQRRAQRNLLKKKRSKYYYWYDCISGTWRSPDERLLGIIVNTPKMCSCMMCGNTRYYLGKTLQEQRADISYNEELEQL